MEEVLYLALNGLSHMIAGAASGKAVRVVQKSEYDGRGEALSVGTDAFLGLSPDADVVVDFLGKHRGYLHIPYVEALYGGVIGFAKDVYLSGKIDIKNNLENSIPSAVAAVTHFVTDYLSGGSTPVHFGVYADLWESPQDYRLLVHGLVAGMSLAVLFYVNRRWAKRVRAVDSNKYLPLE